MRTTALSYLCVVALLVLGCGDDGPMSPDGGGCVTDEDCSDGVFCNGEESCSAGACMRGTAPCEGLCEETMDQCLDGCAEPDADGDGDPSLACGGTDCDDDDPNRFAGATEICDTEGVDEDCNPETVGDRDLDGDGHIDAACCNGSNCGDDCADRMADVFGGATETCDLRDQDCDGNVDEGVAAMRFVDTDGDLYGDDETIIACAGAAKTSPTDIDCDNGSAPRHGAQLEVCDGIDNDCDETVDENTVSFTWYPDTDGDGFGDPAGTPVVACAPPADHSLLPLDCNDDDAAESPAAPELCNGLDDDCDGVPSFEIRRGDTEDDDRDGYGDEACGGDDCDDRDPFNHPGGVELCDGVDNDCDGMADESVEDVTWYLDVDGDGHGDPALTIESCERQSDRVLVGDDCADGNPLRHPGRLETCNGVDDDCDGDVDEGNLGGLTAYRDDDGDGFGVTATPMFVCADTVPSGFAVAPGDCDDTDAAVVPGAVEVCDGIDNDCDGATDDGPPVDWFQDLDGDGYGSGAVVATQCAVVAGAVPRGGDCDEGDATRFPGAAEACNGEDDDCDSTTDEGAPMEVYYDDGDGDGYAADGAAPSMGCTVPVGSTTDRGDCDDGDASFAPGEAELCDGLDQDCDGTLDEGLPTVTVYPDGDDDGYADDGATAMSGCGVVPGFADQLGDCDDADPDTNPGATDVCNGVDDDCSGSVDDGTDNFCSVADNSTGFCEVGGEPRECACSGDFADCDLAQTNGCEVDLMLDNEHCGGCDNPCTTTEACQGGTCQPAMLEGMVAGFQSTCAIREQDRILCFGRADGLFESPIGARLTPTAPETLAGFEDIQTFETGHHTSGISYCAIVILSGGARDIYCWGENTYGQIGDGTIVNDLITTPRRIAASVDDVIDDWVDIASSGEYVLALRANGEVYGWGRNNLGQLGRGSTNPSGEPVPSPVDGLDDAVEIETASSFACARTMAGQVKCWGNGGFGALGVDSTASTTAPTQPVVIDRSSTELNDVVEIGLSNTGACARRTDQTVWCWGNLSSDGFYPTNRDFATETQGLALATDLDCGNSSCCAVAAGNVWCWGSSGSSGQYGDGTIDGRKLPVRVLTDTGFLQNAREVVAGYAHMCAFIDPGDMVCWGNNNSQQLGRGSGGNRTTAGAPDLVFGP